MSERPILLEIPGVDAELRVHACQVEERACAPTVAHARCAAFVGGEPAELAALHLIGRAATLTLRFHGVERRFALAVEAVEERDAHARVTLASPVARLDETRDYRVFVDESATEIAARVLGDHGVRLDLRARRAAAKRPHCAQVFESDLGFCARLLAEEGMSWFPDEGYCAPPRRRRARDVPRHGRGYPVARRGGARPRASPHRGAGPEAGGGREGRAQGVRFDAADARFERRLGRGRA